jgi:hypothetical protein
MYMKPPVRGLKTVTLPAPAFTIAIAKVYKVENETEFIFIKLIIICLDNLVYIVDL